MKNDAKRHNGKKGRRGFSISEMLIAVLIMTFVALMMSNGIGAAGNAARGIVEQANAQLLLSTTVTELRTQLSRATGPSVADDGQSVSFTDPDTNLFMTIASTDAGIELNYAGTSGKLVSKEAANKNLHAECSFAATADGMITVRDLTVLRDADDKVCVRLDEYLIKNWQ